MSKLNRTEYVLKARGQWQIAKASVLDELQELEKAQASYRTALEREWEALNTYLAQLETMAAEVRK